MNRCQFSFWILTVSITLFGPLYSAQYTFDPPFQISQSGQSASNAELCVTDTGNAVAVWTRSDGANNRIQGAQFSIATDSWTIPVTLSSVGITASTPAICCDSSGNAVTVWVETGPGNIRSARYNAATGTWSAPINIALGAIAPADPQVSCDPNGNALAVWHIFSGGFTVIQASRFNVGTMTWSAPTTLSAPGVTANDAEISVDDTGDAVAIWQRGGVIQSSSFDVGTLTWTAAVDISSGGSTTTAPQVGVSAAGDAIAIWERSAPSVDIRAARYNKGAGTWSAPVSIVASAAVNQDPILAVNDSLQALAVWEGFDGVTVTIRAASFNPTTNTWSAVQDVDPGVTTIDTDVAIDNSGNGVAVFERFAPPQEGFASCFDLVTNSWSTPVMISSPGENINNPQVQAASSGIVAIALFTGVDGIFNVIEASTGLGSGLLLPPAGASGKRIKNRFPFQKEYFNELSWTPSTSSIAAGYQIFRNGTLIANLSGGQHRGYRDHNRPKKGTDVYTVFTLDVAGGKSSPITIVVN
ncbi:MAG: hypothetical protein KDK64_04865 [Chlamydiia bacterium]|nr:hypothetical protein [Chlamydiia bacterium]